MRKRSNPTNKSSYFQFCDLLAVFCARLTEYRFPIDRESDSAFIAELDGLRLSVIGRPGSRRRRRRRGSARTWVGSWGGAPTLLAEGHAKEPQATRSVRKRAEGKEAQPTRREPKATGVRA